MMRNVHLVLRFVDGQTFVLDVEETWPQNAALIVESVSYEASRGKELLETSLALRNREIAVRQLWSRFAQRMLDAANNENGISSGRRLGPFSVPIDMENLGVLLSSHTRPR